MKLWPFNRPDPHKMNLANVALEQAENDLERTKARGREVAEVTGHIRRYREENGFSGLFREAMRKA